MIDEPHFQKKFYAGKKEFSKEVTLFVIQPKNLPLMLGVILPFAFPFLLLLAAFVTPILKVETVKIIIFHPLFILGCVLLLFLPSLFFIYLPAWTKEKRRQNLLQTAQSVEATVIQVDDLGLILSGRSYKKWTVSVKGQTFTFKDFISPQVDLKTGDSIKILYDQNHPNDSLLKGFY